MLSSEHRTMIGGALVVVIISAVLNLVFGFDTVLSLVIAGVIGIGVGFLIDEDRKDMVNKILGIIGWGLILYGVVVGILKWVGVVGSPSVSDVILGGIVFEFLRFERRIIEELSEIKSKFKEFGVKLNILWSDFRKRKEI